MGNQSRLRRLVASLTAALAAVFALSGVALTVGAQPAGAAIGVGPITLLPGANPELLPQNTRGAVLLATGVPPTPFVTQASGAGAGFTFPVDSWAAGNNIDISVAPSSGANCATQVPFGVNQSQDDPANYVGFSDFTDSSTVFAPTVFSNGGGPNPPTFTVTELNQIPCSGNETPITFQTLRLTFTNNPSSSSNSIYQVFVGASSAFNGILQQAPILYDVGWGAATGAVRTTVAGAASIVSGVTVTGQTPQANVPASGLVRDSASDAVGGAISNFTVTENIPGAVPAHDGHHDVTSVSTTSASAAVTAAVGKFSQADVGAYVSGPGIPLNTTILSVLPDGSGATLSQAATATAVITLTIESQPAVWNTWPSHVVDTPTPTPGFVCVQIDNQTGNSISWGKIPSSAWSVNPNAGTSGFSASAGPAAVVGSGSDILQLPVDRSSNTAPTTWTASSLSLAGVARTDGPVWAYVYFVQTVDQNGTPIPGVSCTNPQEPHPTTVGDESEYQMGYVQLTTVSELAPSVYGNNAEATAAQAVNHQFDYNHNSCISNQVGPSFLFGPSIFLARSDDYHDALAAQYAAGSVQSGVVLTPTNSLDPQTLDTIRLQGAETVFVAGGPLAVSDAVVAQLQATPSYYCGANAPRIDPESGHIKTLNVIRIFGPTYLDTARQMAEFAGAEPPMPQPAFGAYGQNPFNKTSGLSQNSVGAPAHITNTALLVTGNGFQDAVSASVPAYSRGMPLIVTDGSSLSPQALDAIFNQHIGQVIVVGGPLAISDNVMNQLAGWGVSALRIAGTDGSDTSVQLASFELSLPLGLGFINSDHNWERYVNRTAGTVQFNNGNGCGQFNE